MACRNVSEPKSYVIATQDKHLRCTLEQLSVHIHVYHIKVLLLILAKNSLSKENQKQEAQKSPLAKKVIRHVNVKVFPQ